MRKLISIFILFTFVFGSETTIIPLSKKAMYGSERDAEYQRGTYLILLANSSLLPMLQMGDDFIYFKNTQGYDVDVVALNDAGLTTAGDIKNYLEDYYSANPMLEYLLLVGDISGSQVVPTNFIQSINEPELDVTDHPYTFFTDDPESDEYDVMTPKFIVGRWSVQNSTELLMIKTRSIEYIKMNNLLGDGSQDYLNRALLVAGNYKTADGVEVPSWQWPVTPVWTSYWLYDLLVDYGYTQIDTAFFHAGYPFIENPTIHEAWSNGAGIVTYRGWGNSHGWHRPEFYISDINDLTHGWRLPIVFSCVCNTGDFGADLNGGPVTSFGEALITAGTFSIPKGAASMIGPSDLDTDTRYNNVLFGGMWDAMLNHGIYELGPVLFAGKQALLQDFPHLAGPGDVVEFYHHIYGVIGDPSIPVWLLEPQNIISDLEDDNELHNSFLSTIVTDESGVPLNNVVGALMYGTELIGKGLSHPNGLLEIDFSGVPEGAALDLFFNKPQFYQKSIEINYLEDNGELFEPELIAEFDVQPVLTSGQNYIEAASDFTLALDVINPSPFNYVDIEVVVTESGTSEISGEFTNQIMNINAFSTVTTGVLIDGSIGFLPKGYRLNFDVDFLFDGQIIGENAFNLIIGPIESTDPVPPCEYGYWAYDNYDTEYAEAPVYDWIDISEIGENLNLWDDTHINNVEIGFPFHYFGEAYNSVTVCSNGWISFIPCNIDYFWNFSIPMIMGPSAMIAPFMDDLDDNGHEPLEDLNNNGVWDDGEFFTDINENGVWDAGEPFDVYAWTDTENGQFIIQWDNVSNGEDDHLCPDCVKETIQVILYDPVIYGTATGDGEIKFQYYEIHDIDTDGNFSTIGIESPDQNDGVQYLFNNILAQGAAELADGLAIKFTTDAPPICDLGDVNGDGAPDVLDAVMMVSVILFFTPELTDEQFCAADIIVDGAIDILDVVALIDLIL